MVGGELEKMEAMTTLRSKNTGYVFKNKVKNTIQDLICARKYLSTETPSLKVTKVTFLEIDVEFSQATVLMPEIWCGGCGRAGGIDIVGVGVHSRAVFELRL